jgi:thymidylate synthase
MGGKNMEMQEFNLERLNNKRERMGYHKIELSRTSYRKPIIVNDRLVDANGNPIGTKGDMFFKKTLDYILQDGCMDNYPRPVYKDRFEDAKYDEENGILIPKDGKEIKLDASQIVVPFDGYMELQTKAHTLSVNKGCNITYDLSKGESPVSTLRPLAFTNGVAEIDWIYLLQSNDLVDFDRLLGKDTWDKDHQIHNWWLEWAILDDLGNYVLNEKGHPIIGKTYGGTVGPRDMTNVEVISQLIDDRKRDGRRIMISLWQIDDYKEPHGLKPCAFCTIWNVRRGWDGVNYLDVTLIQRSSDFCTASVINQTQYVAFQKMIAAATGLTPGYFTWNPVNVQIYDRHLEQAMTLLDRDPFDCEATIELKDEHRKWEDETVDNVYIKDYPREDIKKKNYQLKFPIGV